jgi:hypothetical protein
MGMDQIRVIPVGPKIRSIGLDIPPQIPESQAPGLFFFLGNRPCHMKGLAFKYNVFIRRIPYSPY